MIDLLLCQGDLQTDMQANRSGPQKTGTHKHMQKCTNNFTKTLEKNTALAECTGWYFTKHSFRTLVLYFLLVCLSLEVLTWNDVRRKGPIK